MLKLKNISKHYLNQTVLKNVSLTVPVGSITGIIGPNGAGKSTLIKVITGFEFQEKGEVFIDGKEMKNFNMRKSKLSYMPENMVLYPEYFVSDFLDFFKVAQGYEDLELFNSLSLDTVLNKKIGHLSKGWHQRLKLYVALANEKSIVVLDEPFDGFDPVQMKDIIGIFKSQNKNGRSFILSIHQLSDAEKICDYFVLLDAGEVVACGSLDELKDKFSCNSKSLEEIFLKVLVK